MNIIKTNARYVENIQICIVMKGERGRNVVRVEKTTNDITKQGHPKGNNSQDNKVTPVLALSTS